MKNYILNRTQTIAIVIGLFLIVTSFYSATSFPLNLNESPSSKENNRTIKVQCRFEQPAAISRNGFDYIKIDGLESIGSPGEPELPIKGVKILLPPNSIVNKIVVTPSEKRTLPGSYIVKPGQKPVPINYRGSIEATEPDPEIYESNNPCPGILFKKVGVQRYRGYNVFILNLYPVQYIPAAGEIYYYEEMEVCITTSHSKNSFSAGYRGLSSDKEAVKVKVDNADWLNVYEARVGLGDDDPVRNGIVDPEDTYKFVIITTEDLKNANGEYTFQDLAQAKSEMGINTTIVTVEDIVAEPAYWCSGEWGDGCQYNELFNDTQAKIRNFIRDAYHNWETEYILLGGDNETVPARMLYAVYQLYWKKMPSDLYYACLDGSFNSDGDDKWGRYWDGQDISGGTGDVDLMAEVYVGRACVDDATEIAYFVNKTLAYMNSHDEYLNDVLMAGEYLLPGLFGRYYLNQVVPLFPSEYNISTLYDSEWPGLDPDSPWSTGWPKEEIIGRINNGTHIINHAGHASPLMVMKLFTSDIEAFTNNQYCFIYSWGCDAGAFDFPKGPITDDCMAEQFTVKHDHGAFAVIMNARYGFFGGSNVLLKDFWDAVFGEHITVISEANQDSKEDNIYRIDDGYYDPFRWLLYGLNLFGDPSLSFNLLLNASAKGPYKGVVNESIQFQGSAVGGSPPYSWNWDFGDDNISTGQNPEHVYSDVGNYTVTLTVTDSGGNISRNTTIAIIHEELTANAYGPYLGVTTNPMQFTGSASGGFSPYSFSWDFGDGQTSNEQNPAHFYSILGDYVVTLTVNDSLGNIAVDVTEAHIIHMDVEAHGPYEGTSNLSIQFNGSASGGFPPYTWSWEFGDGNVSEEQNPTHYYANAGVYQMTLTVIDSQSFTAVDTTEAHIIHMDVEAHGPYEGLPDISIQFSGSAAGGYPPYTWNWDFGDETVSDQQNPLKIFDDIGEYIVTLTVTDTWNISISDTTTVMIFPPYAWVDDDFNETTPGWDVDHFASIQSGINAVGPNGSVYVYNGTYNENIDIEKTIHLIGEDKDGAVIDGNWSGHSVCVAADMVKITGFTIQNGSPIGIYVTSNNVTITGNNLCNNEYAVSLSNSDGTVISENIIEDNVVGGIDVYTSNNNTCTRNTITNNGYFGISIYTLAKPADFNTISENIVTDHLYFGIAVSGGSNNTISGNTIANNTYYGLAMLSSNSTTMDNTLFSRGILLYGMSLSEVAAHTIENNTVNGRPIRYYKNTHDVTIPCDTGQVILANCTTCIIQNLNFSDLGYPIQLCYSSFNQIMHNLLANNVVGINLLASPYNQINRNTITGNIVGISVASQSDNNSIYENDITTNDYGIITEMFLGLSLKLCAGGGESPPPSTNNTIYWNNFIENSYQAYDSYNNTWYNKTIDEGNYWSDFDEPNEGAWDNNSDGIIDSPYNIPGGKNQDLFPLMFPVNYPPQKPSKPSGSQLGIVNKGYIYNTSATDPEGDDVFYKFDWGDDSTSIWLGPYDSGEEISASHIWPEIGTYQVRVKAKDMFGHESDWSDPLSVKILSVNQNQMPL